MPGCSECNEDNQSAQNYRSRILDVRIRQLLQTRSAMSALPLPPSRNTSEKHSVSTVAGFAGLIIIAKRAATSFWPPGVGVHEFLFRSRASCRSPSPSRTASDSGDQQKNRAPVPGIPGLQQSQFHRRLVIHRDRRSFTCKRRAKWRGVSASSLSQ